MTAAFLHPAEQLLAGVFPSAGERGNFSVMFTAGAVMAALAFATAMLVPDRYRPAGIRRPPELGSVFRREAALAAFLNFAVTVPFAAVLSLVPIYARDHGLGNPGLFFTVYSGMVLVMRLAAGRVSDAYGRATLFLPGLALVGASMLTLVAAAWAPVLLFAAVFYGAGTGLAQPSLTAYRADLAPPHARGAAIGTFSLGFDLALSFGAWGLGLVVAQAGTTGAFSIAAALPFVGIGAYFLWGRHSRASQTA